MIRQKGARLFSTLDAVLQVARLDGDELKTGARLVIDSEKGLGTICRVLFPKTYESRPA